MLPPENPPTPSLLLLPHRPTMAAHHDALVASITTVRTPKKEPTLIAAIPIARDAPWEVAQAALAQFYALLAAVCAELEIPSESDAGKGNVDVVAVLVSDEDHGDKKDAVDEIWHIVGVKARGRAHAIDDMRWLAYRRGDWKTVFYVDDDEGVKTLKRFRNFSFRRKGFTPVPAGPVPPEPPALPETPATTTTTESRPCGTLKSVILGGTFDHLHPGHKLLLSSAVLLLSRTAKPPAMLRIGVSAEEMLTNKKFPEHMQGWFARVMWIMSFFSAVLDLSPGPSFASDDGIHMCEGLVKITTVPLTDAFGPTVEVRELDALVVSRETVSGGNAVNEKRAEKGWHGLDLYVVDVLNAKGVVGGAEEGWEDKISSTAIRARQAEIQAIRKSLGD